MSDPRFVIPAERLPPGFAEAIDNPPAVPAEPKPAATVVLMRDRDTRLEILLLKRHRSVGFVPGAYVFPGGRIDEADADPRLTTGAAIPKRGDVPAHYWFGAVREVFEEAGVLLARTPTGEWAPDARGDKRLERWRMKLMANEVGLADVVAAEQLQIVLDDVVYFAHWITPAAEPRRYDTRFFAAGLPAGRTVQADPRETVDTLWLTAADALARFEEGRMPMVFPTVKTLQELRAFTSVYDALSGLKQRTVPTILPHLVRTQAGVGIVIDEGESTHG